MNATDFNKQHKFEHEGIAYLKLCYSIVLYWIGELERQSTGLKRFFEIFVPKIADEARMYQTTNMKRPKKLTVMPHQLVDAFLLRSEPADARHLRIDNRLHKDEAPDTGIELVHVDYRNVGYAIARMNPEKVTSDELLQMARSGVEQIAFAHGFCGFALCYNDLGELASLAEPEFYALARRYCGLDLPCANNTSFVVDDGLKCVNWLTFVGNDLMQQRGFVVPKSTPPDIVVHHLQHGLMLQAGASPCIGDVNRKETCKAYHVAGRLLSNLRTRKHPAFILGADGVLASDERTEEWLSRFDE